MHVARSARPSNSGTRRSVSEPEANPEPCGTDLREGDRFKESVVDFDRIPVGDRERDFERCNLATLTQGCHGRISRQADPAGTTCHGHGSRTVAPAEDHPFVADIWIASMTREVRVLDERPPQFDGGSKLARLGLARRRGGGGSRSIGATKEQESRPHERAQRAIRHDVSTYVPTTLGRIEVLLPDFCHVPRLASYDVCLRYNCCSPTRSVLGENMGPPCSLGVYIGAAGLALAGIALIAYLVGRERSRAKVFLLIGAGLLSAVLIVTGVELKLREEHDVVKSAAGTEVVCHHG
jgi:hypothetical protein